MLIWGILMLYFSFVNVNEKNKEIMNLMVKCFWIIPFPVIICNLYLMFKKDKLQKK